MHDDTKKFFEKLAGVIPEENQEQEFEPQLVKAETAYKSESKKEMIDDVFDGSEGQLAIDVYQNDNDFVIESAVAGINMDDLDLEISPESVTIRGRRENHDKKEKRDYLFQECYWGKFSRQIILPQEINTDHVTASFKNGILRIVLPKLDKKKAKKVKVRFE